MSHSTSCPKLSHRQALQFLTLTGVAAGGYLLYEYASWLDT